MTMMKLIIEMLPSLQMMGMSTACQTSTIKLMLISESVWLKLFYGIFYQCGNVGIIKFSYFYVKHKCFLKDLNYRYK